MNLFHPEPSLTPKTLKLIQDFKNLDTDPAYMEALAFFNNSLDELAKSLLEIKRPITDPILREHLWKSLKKYKKLYKIIRKSSPSTDLLLKLKGLTAIIKSRLNEICIAEFKTNDLREIGKNTVLSKITLNLDRTKRLLKFKPRDNVCK